jgi:hypothetical protein
MPTFTPTACHTREVVEGAGHVGVNIATQMVSFDTVAAASAEPETCAPPPLTRCRCGLLILNDHRRVGIRGGNR